MPAKIRSIKFDAKAGNDGRGTLNPPEGRLEVLDTSCEKILVRGSNSSDRNETVTVLWMD